MPSFLPSCCFEGQLRRVPTRFEDFDLRDPQILCLLATLLESSAEATDTSASNLISEFLPDFISFIFVANDAGFTPGSLVITMPDVVLVFVPGTSNPLQYSLQLSMALGGMTNFGLFSTLAVWFFSSTVILDRIVDAEPDATKPIVLIGHSMGSAVSSVLAARLHDGNRDRQVKLLGFASPKPGDIRLCRILSEIECVYITNEDDPVPSCPPNIGTNPVLAGLAGVGGVAQWSNFKRCGTQLVVNVQGDIDVDPNDQAGFLDLLSIVTSFATNIAFNNVDGHAISTYVDRICPDPEIMPDQNGYAIYVGNENAVTDDDFRVDLNGRTIGYIFDTERTCNAAGECRGTIFLPYSFSPATMAIEGSIDDCAGEDIAVKVQYVHELEDLPEENVLRLDSIHDAGCGNFGVIKVWAVTISDGEITITGTLLDDVYETGSLNWSFTN